MSAPVLSTLEDYRQLGRRGQRASASETDRTVAIAAFNELLNVLGHVQGEEKDWLAAMLAGRPVVARLPLPSSLEPAPDRQDRPEARRVPPCIDSKPPVLTLEQRMDIVAEQTRRRLNRGPVEVRKGGVE